MTNLRQLFDKARHNSEQRSYTYARLGKHNPSDSTITYEVTGRVDWLYVTLPDGTVTIARNEFGVAQVEDMQVRLRRDNLGYVIVGRSTTGSLTVPAATPPSGVNPHDLEEHSDVVMSSQAIGDLPVFDGTNWINSQSIPGAMAATTHAATGKTTPVDADEVPLVDSAASNVLKKVTWANLKATLKTYLDTLYQAVNTALLKDGSVALTADWDIGNGRKIKGDTVQARDSDGLSLLDDAGNLGMRVNDGGGVQVGVSGTVATFGDGSSSAGMNFNGAAGAVRDMVWLSGGSARWIFRCNSTAEGGSNAGSDIEINSRTDGGAALQTVLKLFRSTGQVIVGLTSAGATILGIKAGASSNDAAVGGTLYVDSGTHANSGTTETDLTSYSVPANTLSANNMRLEFEAWVWVASNANTKTIKFKWGSTTINLGAFMPAADSLIHARGFVVRTGAATQDIFISYNLSEVVGASERFTTAAETLSSAVTLKFTGQSSAASNDIKQEFVSVLWHDANT